MQRRPLNRGWDSVWAAIVALTLCHAGCDQQPEPAGPAASPAKPPTHPAMQDTPGPAARSGHAGATGLPAGHPPVASTSPATGGAAGAAAPEAGKGLAAQLSRLGLAIAVPPDWREVASTSSMRMATLRIPGSAGEGEMSVMLSGGNLQSNIDRWRGQFQENPQAVSSRLSPGGLDVTVVEMEGTFSAGSMGGGGAPQAGTKLLGAIVAVPGMDQSLFFKSWGPKATMDGARTAFDALIGSLRVAQ